MLEMALILMGKLFIARQYFQNTPKVLYHVFFEYLICLCIKYIPSIRLRNHNTIIDIDGRLGIVTAGDVVLEFVNNAALTGAVQNMTGRKYEGRPVQMRPIDLSIYEIILKEIVPIQDKLLSELVYSDTDDDN